MKGAAQVRSRFCWLVSDGLWAVTPRGLVPQGQLGQALRNLGGSTISDVG